MTDELQFLELSLSTPDVRHTLEWYCELGFIELSPNEVHPYHYAVISDGNFCIGLHDINQSGPALTFVRPNLASHTLERIDAGEEFDLAALGIDDFHKTMQADPDGSLAIMLEARTFSPSHETAATPVTGILDSLVLPCLHIAESLEFWQRYGFMAVESEDTDYAELHRPGLVIVLHAGMRHLLLRFQPKNYDRAVATLNRTHRLKMIDVAGRQGVELTAPEGTRLQLLKGLANSH